MGDFFMRIGEFSKYNNVTIDTVRHYMELGLIIPQKNGGHYSFSDYDQACLIKVIELKDMGFTLGEIKQIVTYEMLGKLTGDEENSYFTSLYRDKLVAINEIISKYNGVKARIEDSIEQIANCKLSTNQTVGMHISALNILVCNNCTSTLDLKDAQIKDNKVLNGTMRCTCCNNTLKIIDGILIGDGAYDGEYGKGFYTEDFVSEYISETHSSYLDELYRNNHWFRRNIDMENLREKVILELGSGCGFFLRNIYNKLDKNSIYIAVDNDLSRHKYLKAMLERADMDKNILFICCDFKEIPIRDKSVDTVMDITGSSNYAFGNSRFLLDVVDKKIKDDADLICTYIIFKKFGVNSYITELCRDNFKEEKIIKFIEALDYKINDSKVTDGITQGGIFEDFFRDDEIIYYYLAIGKKNRK